MILRVEPNQAEGYRLMHDGMLCFADLDQRGICVDTDYVNAQIGETNKKVKALKLEFREYEEVKKWRSRFGANFNEASPPQLAWLLYQELKQPVQRYTDKNQPSTDEDALMMMDLPFVQTLLNIRKMERVANTYLANILSETVDGILRPSFHLGFAKTYRSQSDSPNFQNIPIRIPEMAKIIRPCFRARPGHQLLEIDNSGAEVRGAACYHEDPRMVDYIKTGYDFHKELALEIFLLIEELLGDTSRRPGKTIRHISKNKFVFPEFFGNYYEKVAADIWWALRLEKPTLTNGMLLMDWLGTKGLNTLRKFTEHIKQIEDRFWNERFPVYTDWKYKWYDGYCRRGYFDTLSGFRCSGVMKRNEAINYPIQGTSFHIFLWGLIRLNSELKRLKFTSRLIGQIHDSALIDIWPPELENVLALAKQIMTQDVRKAWKWITVPLEFDAELAPVDGTWYDKEKIKWN